MAAQSKVHRLSSISPRDRYQNMYGNGEYICVECIRPPAEEIENNHVSVANYWLVPSCISEHVAVIELGQRRWNTLCRYRAFQAGVCFRLQWIVGKAIMFEQKQTVLLLSIFLSKTINKKTAKTVLLGGFCKNLTVVLWTYAKYSVTR
uniref:DUF1015 domain-containing protein n=1 Tax=Mesocestoides corti TaxID=53468 RepID=A0A5K3FWH7_MESCO